jgi:hypothetical protein
MAKLVVHEINSDNQKAFRQFTNREESIKAYTDCLKSPRRDDLPKVLVFYGVGGIGKTALRLHLMKKSSEISKHALIMAYDFKQLSHRSSINCLQSLRTQFCSVANLSFPRYDAAHEIYWEKARSDEEMKSSSKLDSKVADYVADVTSILGVPGGLILRILRDGIIALQKNKAIRSIEILKRLPNMEPQQIVDLMPALWAADCQDFLLSNPDSRPVFFLDTYEALSEGYQTEGFEENRDVWVRDMIGSLPQALWIICGREKLNWSKNNSEWEKCLEQHLIEALAKEDSQRFLKGAGIYKQEIIDEIVHASKGYPFYLDLSCDLYNEILESRPPIKEDFGETPSDIYSRFTYYLQDPKRLSELETLRLLSCSFIWDELIFSRIIKTFSTGYPETAFDKITRFSFINRIDDSYYQMHEIMRDSLQNDLKSTNSNVFIRVHKYLFNEIKNSIYEPHD